MMAEQARLGRGWARTRQWVTAHRADLLAYGVLLALALWIARPVLADPAGKLFAGHGDALMATFWLWWFKAAWLTGAPALPNPMVAAPFGADWGQVIEKGTIWPGIVLARLVNETFAYNVLVLGSFPLAGVAMYHLALHLTRHRPAALTAGLVFMLAPLHLWKSWAWIPLANIQWLAFFALALFRLRERRRLREALWAGGLFALTAISSYVYGVVATVLAGLFVLSALAAGYLRRGVVRLDWEAIRLALAGGAAAMGLALPVVYPLVAAVLGAEAGAAPSKFVWPYSDLFALTAHPTDFLLPSESSWLRAFFAGLDVPDTGRGDYTHGLFLGYTTLALAGLGVWAWWREGRRGFAVPFLGTVLLAGGLLAVVPPEMTVALPGLGPISLKGPGYFGYAVAPWFREYARFGVLPLLAAPALAAFGVRRAWAHWPEPRAVLVGVLALGLTIDFSYRPPPDFPLDTSIRPAVYDWLAEQPGPLTIAEYPIPRSSQVSPVYLFYVTQHGKRVVDGQGFSRQAEQIMPALWDLSEPQTAGVLRYLGADYVLWHETWPGYEQWYGALPNTTVSLEEWEVVERFDTAVALRTQAEPARVIVVPGGGFTLAPAPDLSRSWWWLAGAGELRLYNTTSAPVTVSVQFEVTAPGGLAQLSANDAAGQPLTLSAAEGEGGPRVVVGPVTVPSARLLEQSVAEAFVIRLGVASNGGGMLGLRGFQIMEAGWE